MRKLLKILLLAMLQCAALGQVSVAQTSIVPTAGDCDSQNLALHSDVQAALAKLRSCDSTYVYTLGDPEHYGKALCGLAWVSSRKCIPAGQAVCAAAAKRDTTYANCQAGARVFHLMEGVNRKKRLKGVDEAFADVKPRNEERADLSPAHELSSELSELAYSGLETATRNNLEDFESAFDTFDTQTSDSSFLDTEQNKYYFQPLTDNTSEMPEEQSFDEPFLDLMDLAETVAERNYDLPFGEDFTSSDRQSAGFKRATQMALTGDVDHLKNFGDWDQFSEVTNRVFSNSTVSASNNDNSNRAQDVLRQLEAAARKKTPESNRPQQPKQQQSGSQNHSDPNRCLSRAAPKGQTVVIKNNCAGDIIFIVWTQSGRCNISNGKSYWCGNFRIKANGTIALPIISTRDGKMTTGACYLSSWGSNRCHLRR